MNGRHRHNRIHGTEGGTRTYHVSQPMGEWWVCVRRAGLLLASGWIALLGMNGCLHAVQPGVSEVARFESWHLRAVRVHDARNGAGDIQVTEVRVPMDIGGEGEVASIFDEILKGFRNEGYLLCRISRFEVEPDSSTRNIELDVYVDRGPRCSVASISLDGNRSLDNDAFARLTGITVGALLTESSLRRGIEDVMRWYVDNGYPYAEVEVEGFEISRDGGIDIRLGFDEGKRVRIGNVYIQGNRTTRKDVILRQFGVKPDDTFSMNEIERGRQRLIMTNLYSDVGEVRLVRSDHSHKVDLEIMVEEGKQNTFSGAAGLVPGPGGSVRPTGTLDMSLGNLWGTGRKMNVRWMGKGEGNSQLDLRYREPWIGGSPISGEFRFTQELRDTAFSRLEFEFAGLGRIGRGYGAKFGVEHQSIYSVFNSGMEGKRNGRLSVLLGAYRSVPLDRSSRREWEMDLEFLIGRRRIDGGRFREMEGKGWFSMTPWSRSREDVRLKIGGRFIYGPLRPVPAYQLFSIGGGETVRGYAEDRIWGNMAVWKRTEFSFLAQGRSRYLLFYDIGIIDTSGRRRGVRVIHGFGAGVRITSKLGIMKVDYGLNPDLGLLEGRLHAGWTQGF